MLNLKVLEDDAAQHKTNLQKRDRSYKIFFTRGNEEMTEVSRELKLS
jgi:hypothetical protein